MITEEKNNVLMKKADMDEKTSSHMTGRENSLQGELSDEELESVVGGTWKQIWEALKKGAHDIKL